jgi:tetratricopeptide (TPR) repeat protein
MKQRETGCHCTARFAYDKETRYNMRDKEAPEKSRNMNNVVERIAGMLGLASTTKPENQAMREALDSGRRAKFNEDYDRALEALGSAMMMAQSMREPAAVAVIALHQAEVLIQQRKWDEAEQLLTSLQHTAQSTNVPTQVAYVLSALGTMAQAKRDWAGARAYYEQALSAARMSRSGGAEGRALGHLADVYLHEGNASYAAHLLRDALPKLNTTGDIEMSSYFVGLLGQALIQSGQDMEGQHLLERALQLAQHIHFRMYERHWALVLGERAYSEARYHDAQSHITHALRLFPEDADSPEYVRALCQMSGVSLGLRDYPQGLEYAQKAAALSDQMDEPLKAMAEGMLGTALRGAGRSAEAVPHLQAAADMYERLENTGIDHIQIETLRNLAAAQGDADDETAAATYKRAIKKAEQMSADLQLAQSHRDLGLLYWRHGKKTQAIQEWTAALAIYDEKRHYAQIARLYSDIGNARKSLGQGLRAMKDYEQALMILNSVDEHDLETRGLVLSNAANAYAEQGDVESADAFFNESLTIAEKMGDQIGEATRRGNYGWFLLTVGRPRRAIATLEHALRTSQTLGLTLQAAVQMDNLGLAHDMLADYAAALTHHQQALELVRPLNQDHWQAIIAVNLANTLISLGQTAEAQTLLDDALATARANDDGEVIIRALNAQARVAILRGQAKTVADGLQEALNLARRTDQRRLLAEVLSTLSEQQAATGNEEQSAATWDEAQRMFAILRMPQAKTQPAWLADKTVK